MAGSQCDERAWVRGAQRGSVADLEALFRHHWPRAYRAAYLVVHDSAAAEDIAQEAFLAAVRTLDRFDRRRPFGPWLHRIVVNRAIDWSRARTLRRESGETGLATSDDHGVEPFRAVAVHPVPPFGWFPGRNIGARLIRVHRRNQPRCDTIGDGED